MDARRRFVISLCLLLGFLLIGTVGYMIIEGVGPLRAAYVTVVTISTVGSEHFDPSDAGRVFTMFLILSGVGSVYYASVSLVTLLVSGELRSAREKLKVEKRINELKNHVIVCGYGRVGSLVADQLRTEGARFVVVDNDPEKIAAIEPEGLLYVKGDASEETTLLEAGIARADTLVATLPRDSDNVYVALTARGLKKDLLIIARAESTTTERKLLRAGADRVVCPQVIGAYRISSLVTRPNVVDFVDVAAKGVEFEIDEYRIGEGSTLAGKSLRDSALRQKVDAMVVAIKHSDGRTTFNPSAEEVVQVDDTLIVIGRLDTSSRLAEL
jgi:voltage-gated potassium channel